MTATLSVDAVHVSETWALPGVAASPPGTDGATVSAGVAVALLAGEALPAASIASTV